MTNDDWREYICELEADYAREIESLTAANERLRGALVAAEEHLSYCNYGDSWERECAEASGLAEFIENVLKETK